VLAALCAWMLSRSPTLVVAGDKRALYCTRHGVRMTLSTHVNKSKLLWLLPTHNLLSHESASRLWEGRGMGGRSRGAPVGA